jgi:hypothetical protein
MGNLDFGHHAGFSWYCLFLMFSGIVLLLIAVLKKQTTPRRVWRAIFGVGFLGYGFYLTFIFAGGTYFVFFYAFLVPVWLIVDSFRKQPSSRPQPPLGTGIGNMAGQNPQPIPGLQPMTDSGLPPMADPGLPPMADPGLPPVPPS